MAVVYQHAHQAVEQKKCGSDGCTGSCGNCSSGKICDAGSCVIPTTPNQEEQAPDLGVQENNVNESSTGGNLQPSKISGGVLALIIIWTVIILIIAGIIIYLYLKRKKPHQNILGIQPSNPNLIRRPPFR